MFHAKGSLLDHTPLPFLHSALSLLYPSAREFPLRPAPWRTVWPMCLPKIAARRSRLCSYNQEEQALGRLTTPARTSPPLLRHRKWMKDKRWECWLHRCSHRRERRKCSPIKNLSLSKRKFCVKFTTHSGHGGTSGYVLAHFLVVLFCPCECQ